MEPKRYGMRFVTSRKTLLFPEIRKAQLRSTAEGRPSAGSHQVPRKTTTYFIIVNKDLFGNRGFLWPE
jgi:hypothetical protein